MSTMPSKEQLIADVENTVKETLAYFEGHGQSTKARVDRWGSWDILAHFIYYHHATAWGIASAATGGPPWPLPMNADGINAVTLTLHQGESFPQLIAQLRFAQEHLLRAGRSAQDLDAPAFRSAEGNLVSVRQRLETIARHWRGHLDALKAAGG